MGPTMQKCVQKLDNYLLRLTTGGPAVIESVKKIFSWVYPWRHRGDILRYWERCQWRSKQSICRQRISTVWHSSTARGGSLFSQQTAPQAVGHWELLSARGLSVLHWSYPAHCEQSTVGRHCSQARSGTVAEGRQCLPGGLGHYELRKDDCWRGVGGQIGEEYGAGKGDLSRKEWKN